MSKKKKTFVMAVAGVMVMFFIVAAVAVGFLYVSRLNADNGPMTDTRSIHSLGDLSIESVDSGGHVIVVAERNYVKLPNVTSLRVRFESNFEQEIEATLFDVSTELAVATGTFSRDSDNEISYWEFALERVPDGTHLFKVNFLKLSPHIIGSSHVFYITSGSEAALDYPVVESNGDIWFDLRDSGIISWSFTFLGSCTWEIRFDGVVLETGVGEQSGAEQHASATIRSSNSNIGDSRGEFLIYYNGLIFHDVITVTFTPSGGIPTPP